MVSFYLCNQQLFLSILSKIKWVSSLWRNWWGNYRRWLWWCFKYRCWDQRLIFLLGAVVKSLAKQEKESFRWVWRNLGDIQRCCNFEKHQLFCEQRRICSNYWRSWIWKIFAHKGNLWKYVSYTTWMLWQDQRLRNTIASWYRKRQNLRTNQSHKLQRMTLVSLQKANYYQRNFLLHRINSFDPINLHSRQHPVWGFSRQRKVQMSYMSLWAWRGYQRF